MKLSQNFTFDEMTRTDHRRYLAANREEAKLSPILENLKHLANELLKPIRSHYNRSVNVSSGYRGTKLNRAVKGSSRSQHCKGEAADFRVTDSDLREVFNWIRDQSGLQYGQLILECYDPETNSGWIHISLPRPRRANLENLIATWDAQSEKWNYQPA